MGSDDPFDDSAYPVAYVRDIKIEDLAFKLVSQEPRSLP